MKAARCPLYRGNSSGSREATLSLVYKLSREAEKCWRRLDGYKLVVKVLAGTRYVDGEVRSGGEEQNNKEKLAA